MSDGGRSEKPQVPPPAPAPAQAEQPQLVPGSAPRDRSWPLTDPMRQVRAEKQSASSQIARSLTAWRKENSRQQAAYKVDIPEEGGAPLAGSTRSKMEQHLGADLSAVKLHTSGDSARAAEGLGARAFTVGQDVHFGAGEFQPGTKEGDRLLAHELTHTVQGARSGVQRKAEHADSDAGGAPAVSQPHEPAEKEADATADHVAEQMHGGDPDRPVIEGAVQKAPAIGAKLDGARVFRTKGPSTAPAAAPSPPKNFDDKKKDALAAAETIGDLPSLGNVLGGLPAPVATNQSQAGFRISKLNTAMQQSVAEFAKDPTTAGKKKSDFIDSRLPKIGPAGKAAVKEAVGSAVEGKPADVAQILAGTIKKDFSIVAPEEDASEATLNSMGGVFKVFDAWQIFDGMAPKLKAIWTRKHGSEEAAKAAWTNLLSDGNLPTIPPGMENDPAAKPFATARENPWPGMVSGFVSEGNKGKALANKADAMQKLALNSGWYPSPKLVVGIATAAQAKAGGRIGKPSMFYLLMFAENVYDAKNREHGVTAGGEKELQALQVPIASFMGSGFQVKA